MGGRGNRQRPRDKETGSRDQRAVGFELTNRSGRERRSKRLPQFGPGRALRPSTPHPFPGRGKGPGPSRRRRPRAPPSPTESYLSAAAATELGRGSRPPGRRRGPSGEASGPGDDQPLRRPGRGPHVASPGISAQSLRSGARGPPSPRRSPGAAWRAPEASGERREGALRVPPHPRSSRRRRASPGRVSDPAPRGTAGSLSGRRRSRPRSRCLSLSGLLTTPTPGSPASSGLLTALLLLLLFLLQSSSSSSSFPSSSALFCLLGLRASWPRARPVTTTVVVAAVCACVCWGWAGGSGVCVHVCVRAPDSLNPTPAGPQPGSARRAEPGRATSKREESAVQAWIPSLASSLLPWACKSPSRLGRDLT